MMVLNLSSHSKAYGSHYESSLGGPTTGNRQNKKKAKKGTHIDNNNDDNGAEVNNLDSSKRNNKKPQKGVAFSQKQTFIKLPDASLPDGSKPNFFNSNDSRSSYGKKKNSDNENSKSKSTVSSSKIQVKKEYDHNASSSVKPTIHTSKTKKVLRTKDKKGSDENYAGSSFHFSPEALNLPKPSFKSSPKPAQQSLTTPNTPSGTPETPVVQNNGVLLSSPSAGPIQKPQAVSFPNPLNHYSMPLVQPGYGYSYDSRVPPGGYLSQPPNFPPPNSLDPQPQLPQYVPINFSQQSFVPPSQPLLGQKVSFNDLLSSTKQ